MTKNKVIQKMVEGRESHAKWKRRQRNLTFEGKPEVINVGSAEHHDEWIETYNWVLYYLTKEELDAKD